MKLATYIERGRSRIGVVVDDMLIDSGFDGSMIDLIGTWDDQRPAIEAHVAHESARPLRDLQLGPPVQRPGKIFAIGLNYSDHLQESGMEAPQRQVWFTKAQTSINGPFSPILIARDTAFVDYEVELVVIIGKPGKYIPASEAHEHIFGYCVGNDVSERAWQTATPQWSLGKSFDTHAPIGPWITTTDEVPDAGELGIRCFVNGELRQASNTRHMLSTVAQQIEHLSSAMTLESGDVIFAGTPAGIGATMQPPQFLKDGDVVRCEIDRLGAIEAVMKDDK